MSRLITQEIKDNITQDIANHCDKPLHSFFINKIYLTINGEKYVAGNNINCSTAFDFTVLEELMELIQEIENNPTKQIIFLDDNDRTVRGIAKHFLKDGKFEDIKIEPLFLLATNKNSGNHLFEYKNGEIFDNPIVGYGADYRQSCYE